MIALIIFALMLVLGVAAVLYGADSRDEFADPRRSEYPVAIR